ncbi:MAG: hypothetical protein MI974_34180 [Chitinophagales bacterium]|nr:hypothetical protein [Chitinophagales bacterium]
MKILFTALFSLIYLFGNAQLDRLEYELFDNRKTILYKVDSSTIRCKNSFDKTILDDSIKFVVNVDTILFELKKITFHELVVNKDSLQHLYDRYAIDYNASWGEIYLNRCLREEDTKEANYQFKVLHAFEIALKSLFLKDKSDEFIWKSIQDDYKFIQDLISGKKDKAVLYERVKTYSDIFKYLNERAWLASYVGFTHIEPYLDRIKTYYIDELNNCFCPLDETHCNIAFLRNNSYYIAQIKDNRIPEAFVKNKDCLDADASYFWFPVRYLGQNHHPELLVATLKKLFNSPPIGHIDFKLSHIRRNKKNLLIFHKELCDAILHGSEPAIIHASHFPSKETLKALRKAKTKYRKNANLLKAVDYEIMHIKAIIKHNR